MRQLTIRVPEALVVRLKDAAAASGRSMPLVELGYRHLIANFPAPYDEESTDRFATEVCPLLERGRA